MIARQLLETGILQFGLFVEKDTAYPYRLRLEMLSAYPQLLQTVAYRGVQTLATMTPFDRLVSHADAIPLATALSLNTGISLVYSRGRGEIAVHDLVGAYDVGHPSCLLVNTLTPETQQFLIGAQRVGLEIHSVLELVATGETLEGIDQYSIYTIQALVHELRQLNLITQQLAENILSAEV